MNNYTYATESELVFEIMNTFIDRLSCELSMNQQIEFNKIEFLKLNKLNEFDIIHSENSDSEFVNDLKELQPILINILEEFDLNSLNLFSIHEIENYSNKMIKYSTNELNQSEFLLLYVLNATTFDSDFENEEIMAKDFDFHLYSEKIESELKKQNIIAEYDHYSESDQYIEFYYKIQYQSITLFVDKSKIITFDSKEIDNDKFEDYLIDKFNQNFKYIDLNIYFTDNHNSHNLFEFINESNYESEQIEDFIENSIELGADIYKD